MGVEVSWLCVIVSIASTGSLSSWGALCSRVDSVDGVSVDLGKLVSEESVLMLVEAEELVFEKLLALSRCSSCVRDFKQRW